MPLDLTDDSQHWFRKWLGAVKQQAITWDNVDPDLCRHMVSLGHNELKQSPDRLCLKSSDLEISIQSKPRKLSAQGNQLSSAIIRQCY